MQDLHSITPDYFLEVSGAIIHPLSYQQVSWTYLEYFLYFIFLQESLFIWFLSLESLKEVAHFNKMCFDIYLVPD